MKFKVSVFLIIFSLVAATVSGITKDEIWECDGKSVLVSGDFCEQPFRNLGFTAPDLRVCTDVISAIGQNGVFKVESEYSGRYTIRQNREFFKVPAGKLMRIEVVARRVSGKGKLNFYISANKWGEKVNDRFISLKAIESSDFETYRKTGFTSDKYDEYYWRLWGEGEGSFEIKSIKVDYLDEQLESASVVRNDSVFAGGHFKGPFEERPVEKLGRGFVAINVEGKGQLLSWRLLPEDSSETCFTVSKLKGEKETVIATIKAEDGSCFLDKKGWSIDKYVLRSFTDDSLSIQLSEDFVTGASKGYKQIKVKGEMVVRGGVAVGDLNGDGELDYVVKTGVERNIDPSVGSGWHPSKSTFKIEAYKNDGTFMWQKDLGWNIETGIWYCPLVVADLDGDGKAEVILKTSENTSEGGKDYRGADGRVQSGPQYLSVWDGLTGQEIARTDWVDRSAFESESYGNSVRNQICVSYLDGKTPCVVMLAGTYGHMEVRTFYLDGFSLVPVWAFDNEYLGAEWQGQGCHTTLCVDIDEDGRDEIIVGSYVLDDNGEPMWTLGRGHPDAVYYGDIDPNHPGMELVFLYETRQKEGGIMMTDLKGNTLWALNEPTSHIHGRGACTDFDPNHPGREIYGMNSGSGHAKTKERWLFAADGTLLAKHEQISDKWDFAPHYGFVTGYPISTMFRTDEFKKKNKLFRPDGTILQVLDLNGDWREEVITCPSKEKGVFNIHYTVDETEFAYKSLLTDDFYRSIVRNNTSGYEQHPEVPLPFDQSLSLE